ncbi:MAG: RIP metalloprotease RseP [Bacteroidia bacterium]|nr:RIP metalloprotease RseP [Bacteroidia bacterium]
MNGLTMAAQLILGLSILVTLHELGHYLAARAFGIRVEKFYLFFDAWGFKFFSFRKGETEYGVGWLPLGGYVKISGMIDESLDKDQLATPPQPHEFRSKPAWQRLIVMIAGVAMNVLLGIAIFSFNLINYKKEYLPNNEVKGIYSYSLGHELGLENGDKVVAINGKPFERFEDLLSSRIMFGAVLTVERKGQTIEVVVPDNFYKRFSGQNLNNFIGIGELSYYVKSVSTGEPAAKAGVKPGDTLISINQNPITEFEDIRNSISENKGKSILLTVKRETGIVNLEIPVSEKGTIGIAYSAAMQHDPGIQMKKYSFKTAVKFGTSDAFESLVSNAKGLRKIFTGEEKATESIQGPIGIATIYGATWDWPKFWAITGLLSMVLAFMNMLPIPALDGGHVIFLLVESVTRKKFSDKFMERSQIVGMVILLALMVFAVGNDIWKHILN